MTAVKRSETAHESIGEGRTRYLAHGDKLMLVVIDFEDGPHEEPDPPHSHPHEQITYIAEGELLFFINGKATQLSVGDLITVPPDAPHSIQLISKTARLVDSFTPLREDFLK